MNLYLKFIIFLLLKIIMPFFVIQIVAQQYRNHMLFFLDLLKYYALLITI